MTDLHVLRVFIDAEHRFGNHLGMFPDARGIAPARRQAIAAELRYSETVFVDEPERGVLRIFTPTTELPFAGHPLVGAAWLLRRYLPAIERLRPPAGEVGMRVEDELVWIRARTSYSPPFETVQLESPAAVRALEGPPGGAGLAATWAWEDERAGQVYARVFAHDLGIAEDPATGSAALLLCALTGRALRIRQGAGSELFVAPLGRGHYELGGRVACVERSPGPAG